MLTRLFENLERAVFVAHNRGDPGGLQREWLCLGSCAPPLPELPQGLDPTGLGAKSLERHQFFRRIEGRCLV